MISVVHQIGLSFYLFLSTYDTLHFASIHLSRAKFTEIFHYCKISRLFLFYRLQTLADFQKVLHPPSHRRFLLLLFLVQSFYRTGQSIIPISAVIDANPPYKNGFQSIVMLWLVARSYTRRFFRLSQGGFRPTVSWSQNEAGLVTIVHVENWGNKISMRCFCHVSFVT